MGFLQAVLERAGAWVAWANLRSLMEGRRIYQTLVCLERLYHHETEVGSQAHPHLVRHAMWLPSLDSYCSVLSIRAVVAVDSMRSSRS